MKRRYSYGNWRSLCISIIGRHENNGSINQTFFYYNHISRTVRQCNRNSVIERINAIKKRSVNHRMRPLLLDCLIVYIADRIWCFYSVSEFDVVYHTWHIQGYIRRPCVFFLYNNGSIWRNADQLSRRLFDTNGPESLFYHLSISIQKIELSLTLKFLPTATDGFKKRVISHLVLNNVKSSGEDTKSNQRISIIHV